MRPRRLAEVCERLERPTGTPPPLFFGTAHSKGVSARNCGTAFSSRRHRAKTQCTKGDRENAADGHGTHGPRLNIAPEETGKRGRGGSTHARYWSMVIRTKDLELEKMEGGGNASGVKGG